MTDFARLVLDADTRGLKKGERDLQGLKRQSRDTAMEVDSNASKMTGAFKKIGVALAAFGAADLLFQFGKASVQAAIDAEEMGSAFNVVFGSMADEVRKWSEETGNALGRSTQEIQRGALAFQELFGKALQPEQAAELSKQFAVLTQDLASFKNLSNEVAQQKLFSGLVGEAEPLRSVGVFLNEAAVQAKAAELGLSGINGVLTDQEKIVARAAIIQEQLSAAQGDVTRTSGSAANQIKTMNAAVEELQVAFGQKLLPQLTPLITLTADLITQMANAAQAINVATSGTNDLVAGVRVMAGYIGQAVSVISKFASYIGLTGERLQWLTDKTRMLVSPLSTILSMLGRVNNTSTGSGSSPSGGPIGAMTNAMLGMARQASALNAPSSLPAVQTAISGVGKAATGAASQLRAANDDFGDLFESIFPDSVTRRQMQQLELIDKYQAKLEAIGISRFQARTNILAGDNEADVSSGLLNQGAITESGKAIEDFVNKTIEARVKTTEATRTIAESFGQMADRTLQALDRMVGAIRGGGFLDILGSVLNFGLQLGGMGAFGKTVQSNINRPVPSADGGGYTGAGPRSGGLDGKGGFMAMLHPNETVIDHHRGQSAGTSVQVIPSPYFDVVVDGRVARAAPAIASAGAQIAQGQLAQNARRRVR